MSIIKLLLILPLFLSQNIYAKYCKNPHTQIPSLECSSSERIVNGDFEADLVTNSSQWELFSELTGWTVSWQSASACNGKTKKGALAELQAFPQEQLPNSTQYIELDSDCLSGGKRHTNTKISQKIPAQVGEVLKFKFAYKPRRLGQGHMQLKVRFGRNNWVFNKFKNTEWQFFEQDVLVKKRDLDKNGMLRVSFRDEGKFDTFGMFVDNVSVKATNCSQAPVNCTNAVEVVSYSPVGNIAATRKDPSKALGLPNAEPFSENNVQFVSLGFGGSIVLKLDHPVRNVLGPDLRIWETTGGNESYAQYKEEADVYGSMNGEDWHYLGRVKNDNNAPQLGEVELGSMNEALYIKIVDKSPVVSGRDGFDVDAVTCINQNNEWDSRVFYLDKNAQKIFKVKVSNSDVFVKAFLGMPYQSAHLGYENDQLYVIEASGTNRVSLYDLMLNSWNLHHELNLQSHLTQVAVKEDMVVVNKTSTNELVQYNKQDESLTVLGKVMHNGRMVKLIGGDVAFSKDGTLYLVTQDLGGRLYRLEARSCACGFNAVLIAQNLGKVSGLAQISENEFLVSILYSKQMKAVNVVSGNIRNLNLKGDLTTQGGGADLAN